MAGGIVRSRALDKLSQKAVEAFVKRSEVGKKIADGGGLYLLITPAGTPAWRINYRFAGKYRTYAAGVYPEVSLAKAREERALVRASLKDGIDPVTAKRSAKLANITEGEKAKEEKTFEQFAVEWLERRSLKRGWSEIHHRQVRKSLERYLFNRFGSVPISKVTQQMVLDAAMAVISKRRYETASKLLQNVMLIFASAVRFRHRIDNPAEGLADELIPSGQMPGRRPALLTFPELGDILRRTEMAPIAPQVRLALELVAFSAARIGNVLEAKWDQFDLDSELPTWTIPRDRMKAKRRHFDHKVLLGPTIAADLRAWRSMTGGKGYLFPAPGGAAHLRHETPEKVMRVTLGMDGKHSVHGWRSAFSTLAKESGLFTKDAVNLALDHVHDSQVALAYDRGERLEERKRLADWWDANLSAAQTSHAEPNR